MPVLNDELLKKLEQRLDRRSFLRGSSLAAAALIGAAAFPLSAAAQDQPAQKPADKPEDKNKTEDKKDQPKDEKKPEPATGGKTEEDPFKVTKLDEKGKPYRLCPQCGYNMYQQDKTWSCENCGYSYTE